MDKGLRVLAWAIAALCLFLLVDGSWIVATQLEGAMLDPQFPCFSGRCGTQVGLMTSNVLVGMAFALSMFFVSLLLLGATDSSRGCPIQRQ